MLKLQHGRCMVYCIELKVNEASILFIDSPVGSGYSYVDKSSLLTSDINQIAGDLTQFTRQFMSRYPQFKVCFVRTYWPIYRYVVLTYYIVTIIIRRKRCRLLRHNVTVVSYRPSFRLRVSMPTTLHPERNKTLLDRDKFALDHGSGSYNIEKGILVTNIKKASEL